MLRWVFHTKGSRQLLLPASLHTSSIAAQGCGLLPFLNHLVTRLAPTWALHSHLHQRPGLPAHGTCKQSVIAACCAVCVACDTWQGCRLLPLLHHLMTCLAPAWALHCLSISGLACPQTYTCMDLCSGHRPASCYACAETHANQARFD